VIVIVAREIIIAQFPYESGNYSNDMERERETELSYWIILSISITIEGVLGISDNAWPKFHVIIGLLRSH